MALPGILGGISLIFKGLDLYRSKKQEKIIEDLKVRLESLRKALIVLLILQVIEIPVLIALVFWKLK